MANPDGPWVRFFASDWLAGTRGMTASETGVYITLIATMYENGAPITRNDSRLARVCGLPARNFTVILDHLIEIDKISVDDLQNLWGRKVDTEVRNRSARAERGRLAAQAKHEQKQRPISANAPREQPPSTSQTVPRARASEPEPDSEDIESSEATQRKRALRLPADWSPSPTDAEWIRTKWPGIARATVESELEKFRNYWLAKSGQGATKTDWSRTWHNWMITAMERLASHPPRTSKPNHNDVFAQMRGMLDEQDQSEIDADPDRTIDGRLSITRQH